jgi:hypothetical protein
MNFKEQIKKDVKNVFLNFSEFAETHNLNGKNVLCIIDTDDTKEQIRSLQVDGVFINVLKIFVDSKDISPRPVEGQLFKVDGSLHLVKSVSDESGILKIEVEANEQ